MRALLSRLAPDKLYEMHGVLEHFEEVVDVSLEGAWRTSSDDLEEIPF